MSNGLEWDRVQDYLQSWPSPRAPELVAMEQRASEDDFPIIGPVCGQLCYQLARAVGARRVFELGSGFGYSTAWFARAVLDNGGGEVHHVVWDAALSAEARVHLERLGLGQVVRYHVGEAVGALRVAEGRFDLLFVDIDKEGYPEAFALAQDKVRPGGLLIADNLLWDGRIFDPADQSEATVGIRRASELLRASELWLSTILPIRDGLLVATRR
jgi:caffeoyl-CoA O-methyltransferase